MFIGKQGEDNWLQTGKLVLVHFFSEVHRRVISDQIVSLIRCT
jgi:hypothetical protein